MRYAAQNVIYHPVFLKLSLFKRPAGALVNPGLFRSRIIRAVWPVIFIFLFGCRSEKPQDKSHAGKASSPLISTAYIEKVEDGDTVLAEIDDKLIRVRLLGIDCPEIAGKHTLKTQQYGVEASVFLKKLVEKKWVQMRGVKKDRYDRLLTTLYLGGEDVNLKMIAVGLAEVYPGFSRPEYFEAQKSARIQELGLWSSKKRISPREWRKRYGIEAKIKQYGNIAGQFDKSMAK